MDGWMAGCMDGKWHNESKDNFMLPSERKWVYKMRVVVVLKHKVVIV